MENTYTPRTTMAALPGVKYQGRSTPVEMEISLVDARGTIVEHVVHIGDHVKITPTRRSNPCYGWKLVGEVLDVVEARTELTPQQLMKLGDIDRRTTRFARQAKPEKRLIIRNQLDQVILVSVPNRGYTLAVYRQQ